MASARKFLFVSALNNQIDKKVDGTTKKFSFDILSTSCRLKS